MPMAAIIHQLLRGLHYVYLNLTITQIVFSQISVLELFEWYTLWWLPSFIIKGYTQVVES